MGDSCQNCDKCKELQTKVDRYQRAIELIMKDVDITIDEQTTPRTVRTMHAHNISTTEDLWESFVVINKTKDIRELSNRELKPIQEQEALSRYNKTSKNVKDISTAYGTVTAVAGTVGWLVGFLL